MNLDRRVAPVIMLSTVETTSAGNIGGVEEKILSFSLSMMDRGRLDSEVILALR